MGSIERVKREFPPKHFSLRVESFSTLARACINANVKYHSEVFSAECYSWRLNLYPNGNTKGSGKDHISLYLEIVDLPPDRAINVEFKFFVFNQKENNYLMIKDETTKRFHKMKAEWGYDELLAKDFFKDPSNGYLVNDCCEFGVEILQVGSKTLRQETLTMVKPSKTLLPFKRTFKCFSKMLDKDFYFTDSPISFGEQTWKVKIYPRGYANEMGSSMSLFLELVNGAKLPPNNQVWAEFKLRVIDQRQDKHVVHSVQSWYNSSGYTKGIFKFMPIGDMYEAKKGFVMNDNLIIEVEFLNVSVTNTFSVESGDGSK
ncbi:TRAF-like family protein [Euphorbia peplus]|nr:TRAF-like family protein [Euphorbia peplus]